MTNEYEEAKARIVALALWYEDHAASRNEATTRLHLIDSLFFECLGWDKRTDCISEERIDGTYADYSLHCPRRAVIVEAKREGIYFEIPLGQSNNQFSIPVLEKDVPGLKAVIKQAATYCQERGTLFGVVTNGHQLIAFVGSRQDGLPPEEGRALVFESLESMVTNFFLLWKTLSKSGVLERNLLRNLLSNDTEILPATLAQTISDYPGIKNRNVIQADLQILADLIFEDIIGSRELEQEFLTKCYCQSGALSQYALISKALLSERYASLFPKGDADLVIVPATDKKAVSPELLAESVSRRPILILGDVGVGKTIFFRHFIHVEATSLFENAIVIYIDLGSKAAFAKDLTTFIVDEIAEQLNKDHSIDIYARAFVKAVYHGELGRFERSIYADLKETNPGAYEEKRLEWLELKIKNAEQFLQDAFTHITKGRQRQIVIFLDNADQRTDDFQQKIFIMAQSMAANWPCTVFLALRPETFYRSKQAGSMSAYHLKAFTISPPRVDEVMLRRLDFGLEITSGRLPATMLPRQVSVDFRRVGMFLSIVRSSLEGSTELAECMDNLSGGNIRLALEFVRKLIGSGHIDTRKILEIYENSGRYFLRLHEFLRSVIYGDCAHYDPLSSPICNLFEVRTSDPREHFLSLLLLDFVERIGSQSKRHGFVELDQVYDHAQGLAFLAQQVERCLCTLCDRRLLETAGRTRPIDGHLSTSAVRMTTVGAYHLHRLPRQFVYYDAVAVDTVILDRHFRERILDVEDISARLDRAGTFLAYLDACAEKLDLDRILAPWSTYSAEARVNIRDIQRRIENRENHS